MCYRDGESGAGVDGGGGMTDFGSTGIVAPMLKLIPPDPAGRRKTFVIRGSYLGRHVHQSAGTADKAVARRALREAEHKIERQLFGATPSAYTLELIPPKDGDPCWRIRGRWSGCAFDHSTMQTDRYAAEVCMAAFVTRLAESADSRIKPPAQDHTRQE